MTPEQLRTEHQSVAFRALGVLIGLYETGGIPLYAFDQVRELISEDNRLELLRCEAVAIEEHNAEMRDDMDEQRREMAAQRLADEVAG